MKYLKYLIIMLLLIPMIVLAEDSITISNIEKVEVGGSTEEKSTPIIDSDTIKLNLKMYDIGDSITYKVTIHNNSDDDYYMDVDNMLEASSDYIEYSLSLVGSSNELASNASRELLLRVTYKNQVDSTLLDTNNRFDASNVVRLSMNTIDRPVVNPTNNDESPVVIVPEDNTSTDVEQSTSSDVVPEKNIPTTIENPTNKEISVEKLLNPETADIRIVLIIVICSLSLAAMIFLIINKSRFTKTFLVIISMLLVPTIYAVSTWSFSVEVSIEIEQRNYLFDHIVYWNNKNKNIMTKYEGNVTDSLGVTKEASNVYFAKSTDVRNLIFAGYCWEMIRTTEDKGIKIMYNGEPENGTCLSTRGNHLGIELTGRNEISLSNNYYIYGSSYTIDEETLNFTLNNTEAVKWSESNYQSLIGKYTCLSPTKDTCSAIGLVTAESNATLANIDRYKISSINYSLAGKTSYHYYSDSPAYLGYMYNKTYEFGSKEITNDTNTYKFGSEVTYDSNTKTYTLSGTIEDVNDLVNNRLNLKKYHYTCWDTIGTCSTIYYVHTSQIYHNSAGDQYNIYYMILDNGKNAGDALNEMLWDDEVNKYESKLKYYLERWYQINMTDYTSKLDDVVYCNARNPRDLHGWNPEANVLNGNVDLKNQAENTDLSCMNITDQFTTSNSKAKLKYPIALLTAEEMYNLRNSNLFKKGVTYWTFSPSSFGYGGASNRAVNFNGSTNLLGAVSNKDGVRPVVTLNKRTVLVSGKGSEADPWIVE